MKRALICFSIFTWMALFTSCEETEYCSVPLYGAPSPQIDIDIQLLDQYLFENSLVATEHISGMRMIIENVGTGDVANLCSTIRVEYEAKTLDDNIFRETEENVPEVFPYAGLILGLQMGLQQIREGGTITLFIPSGLAYGTSELLDPDTGLVQVSRNTPVIFKITLIEIL